MDLNEFQSLLANFEKSDNEILQQSTEFYQNALMENPSCIISLHLQNIASFHSQYLISISIILLKRAFVTGGSDFLEKIDNDTIDLISEALPKLFENEDLTPHLFSLLVDTSSYIANNLMKNDKMLNFIPHLVEIVKGMSPTLSPPALNCIVQCNNYVPLTNFETSVETYELISLSDVYFIIATALTNDFSIDFTMAALRMLFSFYKDSNATPQLDEFAQAVTEIYSSMPEQELSVALSDLYVFCKHNCSYFTQVLPILISTLISIVEKNNNENGQHIQTIAANIYICVAQYFGIEFKPFLNDVVASILIASCNFIEDSLQDDIESNSPYSDKAIYYLSEIFSNMTNYQTLVIKLSQEMIQSEEWNCRRSALSAIYQLLLSCETGLDTYFNDILEIIQEHLGDPNHLCRYYSFKSLSELCVSYSPYVANFIQNLIPLVIEVSKAEVNHQAKVTELKSLESMCSNIPSESISPFSQSIMEELLPQIEDPETTLMEQLMIIKCMSKIALSTEADFDQYYPESIRWLKTAIDQIQPGSDDLVRVQTIRTIPLVGKTVKLELFAGDGVEFLSNLLGDVFSNSGENEKSSILYLIQEMSAILPREVFEQFIPPIFNILETTLSKELEVHEYPLSYDISSLFDTVLIQLRSENIIISYSRSQLSLNQECINVVITLIENLKELVIPFARPISKIASEFIKAAYFPPLQSATLKLFDSLIALYSEFDTSILSLFLPYVRNKLFQTISNFFANPLSVLCECFELSTRLMDGYQFDGNITSLLISFLYQQLPIKRQNYIEKSSNENSPELILLDELEISIAKFSKVLLEKFTPNMIESSPIFLDSQCNIFHILYSTDVYLVMSDSETNLVDLEQLIGNIFESLNSTRMYLCYAALISLSKIIQLDSFDSDFIQQSVEKINNIISQYEEDESDLPHKVIDGALICLASIFKITYGKTDLSSIIPIWFKQMPVLLDDPDSSIAFEVFLTLFNDKNPQIFNPKSLAHLLECCSEAISLKKISTEIKEKIIDLLKELFSSEEMITLIQEAVSSLTVRDRKLLQNVIY